MKLNSRVEEFKRMELLEKYTVKLLYEWNNKKLEKNWNR